VALTSGWGEGVKRNSTQWESFPELADRHVLHELSCGPDWEGCDHSLIPVLLRGDTSSLVSLQACLADSVLVLSSNTLKRCHHPSLH
jgi:hypothetical protein